MVSFYFRETEARNRESVIPYMCTHREMHRYRYMCASALFRPSDPSVDLEGEVKGHM